MKLLQLNCRPEEFPGAEEVHQRGFFIGLHAERMTDRKIHQLAGLLLAYDFGK
jgi:hypothetical protein